MPIDYDERMRRRQLSRELRKEAKGCLVALGKTIAYALTASTVMVALTHCEPLPWWSVPVVAVGQIIVAAWLTLLIQKIRRRP